MSRIFSAEEIALGQIPRPQNFLDTVTDLTEQLPLMRGFYGAIICGSVMMGRVKPWSDLDVLVMFDEDPECWPDIRTSLSRFVVRARERSVPLALIPVERGPAKLGHHSLGAGFCDHLAWARGRGLVGRDPLTEVAVSHERSAYKAQANDYVDTSLNRLMKAAITFPGLPDQERRELAAKALDYPFHATRRLSEAWGQPCPNVGQHELMTMAGRLAGLEAKRRLIYVHEFLDNYQGLLTAQQQAPNAEVYAAFLTTLPEAVERSIKYLQAIREQL